VRVYEGKIEHFVSAQSEGIGIRVIRDGRTGFAYAGTLDGAAILEVLGEARDNAEFGTEDEWAGLANPDDVDVVPQELWNEALAACATERKIELTKELERLTLGTGPAHPRRRRELRRRVRRDGCRDDHRHPSVRARERVLRERQHARRRRRRDADGVRVQRRPLAGRVRSGQGGARSR
jgi:predicted Zn-dependent protease